MHCSNLFSISRKIKQCFNTSNCKKKIKNSYGQFYVIQLKKIHKHKMNLQTILMILSIIIEQDSLIIKKEMLYLLKSILPKVKIIGLINIFDILNLLYKLEV